MKHLKKILAIALVAISLFAIAMPAMAETFSVQAGQDGKSNEYKYEKSYLTVKGGITFPPSGGTAIVEFHSYNGGWMLKGSKTVTNTDTFEFNYLRNGNETLWRIRVYNKSTSPLTAVLVHSEV